LTGIRDRIRPSLPKSTGLWRERAGCLGSSGSERGYPGETLDLLSSWLASIGYLLPHLTTTSTQTLVERSHLAQLIRKTCSHADHHKTEPVRSNHVGSGSQVERGKGVRAKPSVGAMMTLALIFCLPCSSQPLEPGPQGT